MKINKKTIGGFLLIVFGVSVFFGGGSFGFIIPLAIGSLMTYAGIKRFAAGKVSLAASEQSCSSARFHLSWESRWRQLWCITVGS